MRYDFCPLKNPYITPDYNLIPYFELLFEHIEAKQKPQGKDHQHL